MRRTATLVLAAVLVSALLAGCSKTPEPVSKEPKVINWAMGADAVTLDVNKSQDNLSGEVIYHVCEPLLRSVSGILKPGVAESYKIAEDGLTYTYRLRDSVWSDGVPVKASDFVNSIIRTLAPATGTSNANSYYPVLNAEKFNKAEITDPKEVGVSAPDDKTLVVKLGYQSPPFFATCSGTYPIRLDIVEKHGESYGSDADKYIGNGPFNVAAWTHDISVEMVKSETYWDKGAVKIDKLNRMVIQDANTRISMYDSGEINFVGEVSVAYENKYENVKAVDSGAVVALEFNLRGMNAEVGRVISNESFRKALSYAVDREPLCKAVSGKSWRPAHRVLSGAHPGVADTYHKENPVKTTLPPNADEAKAQQYLATALSELNMTAAELPEITFLLFDVPTYRLYSEALVDAWKQVLGLDCIKISQLPIPQCIQAGYQGQFDIYFQGIGGRSDPFYNLDYWTTNGAINWTGWSDPTYDRMVAETDTYTNPTERFAKIRECEEYLFQHGPLEPLFYSGSSYVYKDSVIKDVTSDAFGCKYQFVYADVVR